MVLTEARPSFTWTRGRVLAVRCHFKNADSAVGLAVGWPAYVYYVVQALEFNGTVDAQIGSRAIRQLAHELYVNRHVTIHRGGINRFDFALNHAITRIDTGRFAPARNIFRFRLVDLQLRLQLPHWAIFARMVPAVTFWPTSSTVAAVVEPAVGAPGPSWAITPVAPCADL